MTRYFSFAVLLALIVTLVVLLYKVMAGFMVPMFLAAILVVIFRPTHLWIVNRLGGRQKTAAAVTTAGILLAVLIPITLLVLLGAYEGREILKQFGSGSIVDNVSRVRSSLGLDIPSKETLDSLEEEINELTSTFDPSQIPYQHDRVGNLQDTVEYLGDELDLPAFVEPAQATPDSGEQTTDENEELQSSTEIVSPLMANWKEMQSLVNHSKVTLAQLDAGLVPSEKEGEALLAVKTDLDKIRESFQQFKLNLLGGGITAKLKLMANPSDDDLRTYESSVASFLSEKILALGGATTAFLVKMGLGLAIMTISLYFFLIDGPRILESIKGLSPIDDAHEEELIEEFHRVSRAVVIATLLSAIAQGLLAGVGYYVAGMHSVFLLTLLTTCLALVPFMGAAAVWLPVSLYLFFVEDSFWGGIGLAVYGAAVVSMIDNLIKPYVLHGQSNLHPLLALLSVLGGVATLGPIGILVGPMLVVFLQTLLKILQRELSTLDTQAQVASAGANVVSGSNGSRGAATISTETPNSNGGRETDEAKTPGPSDDAPVSNETDS